LPAKRLELLDAPAGSKPFRAYIAETADHDEGGSDL
jgi:hypothetical protein